MTTFEDRAPVMVARRLLVGEPFSLADTCGPVAWSRGRWPNVDWRDGALVWVGWEGDHVVWRTVRQSAPGTLEIRGTASEQRDGEWALQVLGLAAECPGFHDPVIETLRARLPGLRPFAAGSVFEGLISSIIGQSITVAAAAVAQARLAACFAPAEEMNGRVYHPFPRADQVAEAEPALVRQCGVTWRRAEAVVAAARAALDGGLPSVEMALSDPDGARAMLRELPLVGPWTAESALLWGIGLADAHPTGDVALLRAARRAYGRPDLDFKELDRLAMSWRPARGWAARLLWTDLLDSAGLR